MADRGVAESPPWGIKLLLADYRNPEKVQDAALFDTW